MLTRNEFMVDGPLDASFISKNIETCSYLKFLKEIKSTWNSTMIINLFQYLVWVD